MLASEREQLIKVHSFSDSSQNRLARAEAPESIRYGSAVNAAWTDVYLNRVVDACPRA